MDKLEEQHQDWFQIVSDCETAELPVHRIWVSANKLRHHQPGRVIVGYDRDWRIQHVGGCINNGHVEIQHPVYLKAVSNPVYVPPCLDFDGNPIPEPADNGQDPRMSLCRRRSNRP